MNEKKAVDQLEESESGLRDVSFNEGAPAGSWKRRPHYVFLAVLPAGMYVATGVGTRYKATHLTPQAFAPAAQVSPFARTTPRPLSEICAPTSCVDVGLWISGTAGTVGYLPTDAAQASFEQSMTGVTTCTQGRDGYLPLSDVFNANLSQASGRVYSTPEQASVWDRHTSGIETATSEQGATTLFMPAPAARDIYSNKLPQWTDPPTGTTPLDPTHSTLPAHVWVDVREGLREAREESGASLYSTVNPHQSPYTTHVVWNQTPSCLIAVSSQSGGLPSLTPSGASSADAPNEYEAPGAPARSSLWIAPVYEQDPGSVHPLQLEIRNDLTDAAVCLAEVTGTSEMSLASPVNFQSKPALIYNPNGRDTTFTVRDPQSNNLEPEVAATFEYTIQVGHGFNTEQSTDVAALIEVHKPNVVIVEFTLRYFVLMLVVGE